MDRRTAIKYIFGFVAGSVAEYSFGFPVLRTVYQFLSDVDTQDTREIINYPNPGWVQRMFRNGPVPPLIQVPNGAKDFLRYLTFQNPVVQSTVTSTFNELLHTPRTSPLLMGSILEITSRHATTAINNILNDKHPSMESIISVSVPAIATIISPYVDADEYLSIGVDYDIDWSLINGITDASPFDRFVPKFLPARPTKPVSERDRIARWDGFDRSFHTAQHTGFVYELCYAKRNDLIDAQRIPMGAKLTRILTQIPEFQALVIDESAGFAWEGLETKWMWDNVGDKESDGNQIPSGFYDELWTMDIHANTIGAIIGLILSAKNPTEDTLNTAIRAWNNPSFY